MATLGGVTLTNLTKLDTKEVFIGQQLRTANGTMLTDYANIMLSWSVTCDLLTKSQRDAIKAKTDLTSPQTLVDVDGNSYTVVVKRGSYSDVRIPDSTTGAWYALSFELEEYS